MASVNPPTAFTAPSTNAIDPADERGEPAGHPGGPADRPVEDVLVRPVHPGGDAVADRRTMSRM